MPQSHGNKAATTPIHAPGSRSYQGPFGRLFRNLPAWEPAGVGEPAQLADIERLAQEMVEGAFNPALDNETIPAGYTYFGQFVDHDITFDPRSSLQKASDPENLENFRTPAFDLDCIYGRGPDDQPYMYDGNGKFLIGRNEQDADDDLVRNKKGIAIIGDKRNDENIIVSQLQLTFLKFHNEVMGQTGNFDEAQRLVRWHYQWVVVHDWLKRLCGAKVVDNILYSDCPGKPKLCHYKYHEYPFMPVEFSVAAYRLGHSMLRGRYRINQTVPDLPLFDRAADGKPLDDFRGFRPLPGAWTIDWSFFLDFAGNKGSQAKPQFSRKIDKLLVRPVIEMPDQIASPLPNPPFPPSVARSLAFRNLVRAWRLGLPSGQSVARRIGATPLPGPDLPLWRYILEEAMAQHKGDQLGDVGAMIVAETFIGLLAADPSSYYATFPKWEPTLGKAGKNFKLKDIILIAKANIAPPP